MKKLMIYPSRLHGEMRLPPSKSEVLRILLMLASQGKPCTLIGDFRNPCEDIMTMVRITEGLGASCRILPDGLQIVPGASFRAQECDVGFCATALRMSIPIFLLMGIPVHYRMKALLFRRCENSIREFLSCLDGVSFRMEKSSEEAHMYLSGRMTQNCFCLSAKETSQLLSGLVLGLAVLREEASFIQVEGNIPSKPYLDMTITLLERFGRRITLEGDHIVIHKGNAFLPDVYTPEPDASAAIFPFVLSVMGSDLKLPLFLNSLQGDAKLLRRLKRMAVEGFAPIRMDCNDFPDAAPLLALLASQTEGVSLLSGLDRLRKKECDRYTVTLEILNRFGAGISQEGEGAWRIEGRHYLHGGFFIDGYGDHRMVMLITAASLCADAPVGLTGWESIEKSWPCFFEECVRLGGKIQWQAE